MSTSWSAPCVRCHGAVRCSTPRSWRHWWLARVPREGPLAGLTDREREVLHVMATGRNNATIASTLFMSERAVEKHIGAVLQKLGLVDEHVTNRRVMAVLAYLEAIGPSRADPTR